MRLQSRSVCLSLRPLAPLVLAALRRCTSASPPRVELEGAPIGALAPPPYPLHGVSCLMFELRVLGVLCVVRVHPVLPVRGQLMLISASIR